MSDPIVSFDEAAMRGELRELVRRTVEDTLNALLEEEADDLIGADRYERTAGREAYRAGHYERGLTTTSGQVTLRMPKLKGMRFATAIIERYKRRETSVEEAMIEMYLAGVSTQEDRGRLRDPVGRERVGGDRVEPQREGVRGRRGVEEQAADPRVPLRLRRRHLPQEKLGRLLRERGRDGGHRRQRRRLPRGDRGRRGLHRVGRVLARVPLLAQGPGPARACACSPATRPPP